MTQVSGSTQAYRWVILCCSFLVLFVSNGMTIGGIAVFDNQVLDALKGLTGEDISLGQLKARDGLMFLTAGLLGMAAGWLADKVGVKPLIIVGLALLAAGNYFYSQITSLTDIYVIHILFGLVLVTCGLIVNVYLVSRWFTKGRGLAIGLMLSGSSLGNAFFPQLNTWLIDLGGWQQAFEWLALLPLVLLPVVFFFVRSAPETAGVDGGKPVQDVLYGYTFGQALKSRNFWIVGTMAFCTFYSILGMSTTTFNFLSAENYPPVIAATGVSILFIGGLVGKILSGWLAENFGRKQVLLISLALMLTGSFALVAAVFLRSELFIWIGLVGFGFGWGGIYTLIQLLSADLFGLKSLGKILGAVNILDTLGGGLGPVMTAVLFDRTGSFLVSFSVITGLLLVATLAAALLRMDQAAYLQVDKH
jgi:MFS family permease